MSTRASTKTLLVAALAATVVSLTACSSASSGADGDTTELAVAGWGGAYSEATQKYLLDPFTEASGIETFIEDAPGKQIPGLESQADSGKQLWDFVDTLPQDQAYYGYENGLIAKLPADTKAELEKTLLPGAVSDFGFTSASLGVVIVCNSDLVAKCPQNAKEFFDTKNFPGTRTLPAEANESLTFAMIASGVPVADIATTEIDPEVALEQLNRIRDDVTVFWEGGDMLVKTLQNEEAAMGLVWSGRALGLKNDGMNLEFVWQDGLYSPGYFVVAENSTNKEAAFDLMLSIAKNARGLADFAETMNYSVSNPEALEMIAPKLRENIPDSHLDTLAKFNVEWFAKNKDSVEDEWREVIAG